MGIKHFPPLPLLVLSLAVFPTYLYVATPVMPAAGKGHTGIVDRLVHKYIHAAQELFTHSDS